MRRAAADFPLRRIAIGIDVSPPSLMALAAASELASRLRAELYGLFVEDLNLYRHSRLPFGKEVRLPEGTLHKLSDDALAQDLRALALRARQALVQAASSARLPWTFQIRRGRVTEELLEAASEADLLVIGASGKSPKAQQTLGRTAKALLTRARPPVLVVPLIPSAVRSVFVLYDDSLAAERALAAAACLTEEVAEHLTVFLPVDSESEVKERRDRAMSWLYERGLSATFRPLVGSSEEESQLERIFEVVSMVPDGLLVLPQTSPILLGESLAGSGEGVGEGGVLEDLEFPLLLIR